jgi:hypothetical protein
MGTCLNCGAALRGPFCGQCGQRAIPAYPTLREMAADVWHEFSGWDGRFVRTFRTLLHPGALTIEVLEGRRARYVSPLRMYLVASVVYFVIAAAVPNLNRPSPARMPGGNHAVDLTGPTSAEERAQVLEMLDSRAPRWADVLIRPMVLDSQGVIGRFRQTFPRALFALLPLFAAIVAVFYRRRPFSQHLVFSLHLHAATFSVFAAAQLANLTNSRMAAGLVGAVAMVSLAAYGFNAFRRVYRESWLWVALKSSVIAVVYVVALLLAIVATYAWAVLT